MADVNLVIGVDDNGTPVIKAFTKEGVEGMSKFGKASDDAGKKGESAFNKIKNAITKFRPALAAISGILGGLSLAAIVKQAIDFESAFAGVKKTVNASAAELESLRGGIRQMANEMPATAIEIAGVAEAAGQLGIRTENIEGFTESMIKLGGATNLSANEAATSLARLANITGLPQEKFGELGSTIVELGNNLATTEQEIVSMSLRLAGAGSQIGLTEAEILAFAGALSSVGIEAEAGGTAFSKVMKDISVAVSTGSEDLQKFADVATGGDLTAFADVFEKDAAEAIKLFVEGLGRMKDEGTNIVPIMKDLGFTGERVQDTLARASGAGELMAKSLGLANEAFQSTNALNKEAAARLDTVAAQWQVFTNNIWTSTAAISEGLLPPLKEGLKDLTAFIQASKESGVLADVMEPIGKAIGAALKGIIDLSVVVVKHFDDIAIAITAIGLAWKGAALWAGLQAGIPILVTMGNLMRVVFATQAVFGFKAALLQIPRAIFVMTGATSGLTAATGLLSAAWLKLNAAFLANPIAAVGVALVAAGLAVKHIIELFTELVDVTGSVGLAFSELVSVLPGFGQYGQDVTDALNQQAALNNETVKTQEVFKKVAAEMGITTGELRQMAPTMAELIDLSKENIVIQDALTAATKRNVEARKEQARQEAATADAVVASIQNRIAQLDAAGLSTADLTSAVNEQILALRGTLAANAAAENSDAGLARGIQQAIDILLKKRDALKEASAETKTFGDKVNELAKSVKGDTFAGMNEELKVTNAVIARLVSEGEGGSKAVANLRARVVELTTAASPAGDALKAMLESVKGETFAGMRRELETTNAALDTMRGTAEENSPAFKRLSEHAAELTASLVPGSAATRELAESVKGLTFAELSKELATTNEVLDQMRGTAEENSPAFRQLAERAAELEAKIDPVSTGIQQLIDSANQVGPEYDAMRQELEITNAALELLRSTSPQAAEAIKALEQRALELKNGLDPAGASVRNLVASFEGLKIANVRQELEDAREALRQMGDGSEYVAGTTERLEQKIRVLEALLDPTGSALQRIKEGATKTGPAFDALRQTLVINEQALVELREELGANHPEVQALAQRVAEMRAELDPTADSATRLAGVFSSLGDSTASLGSILASVGSGLLGDLQAGFLSAVDAGGGFGDSLKSAFSNTFSGIKDLFRESAKDTVGGFTAAIGSSITDFQDSYKSAGQKVGGAIGGGIGAYFGGPIGAGIGNKIGGWIGGLFDEPAWKEAQSDIEKNLGVTISEGTAKAIADIGSELGVGIDLAQLIGLPMVIAEAEIGADNLHLFADEAAKLFDVVAQGGEVGEAAMQALNDSYGMLIDSAIEADATWTPAFANLIENAKQSGIEIAAVTEFIGEKMSAAAEGMNEVWEHATDLTVERFNRLGELSAAVFEGLSQGPGGFLEAIEVMGPGLDRMIEQQKELGVESSEATRKMLRIRRVVSENEGVFKSLEGLTKVAQGLGEAGFFTAGAWDAIQKESTHAFNALTKAGLTEREAIEAQQPLLQELLNEHLRTGKAMDANTARLVTQGIEMGVLSEHGTGLELTLLRGFDAVLQGMEVAFGKEMPRLLGETAMAASSTAMSMQQSFAGSNEAITGGMQSMVNDVQTGVDEIAGASAESLSSVITATEAFADGATGSVGRMVGNVLARLRELQDIRFKAKFEVDSDIDLEGRQHGGPVSPGVAYRVGEQGDELFVPEVPGNIIPHGQFRTVSSAEAGGSVDVQVDPSFNIFVEIDGTKLDARVVRTVQTNLDSRELEVPSDTVVRR